MVLPLWVLFLIISMVCEQIANILAKQFAITGRRWIAVLSIIGFILTNIPWIASLRSGLDLSQGAIIFLILNSVSAVVIGIVFYREKITLSQLVGLALGLVALVFLSL